MRPDKKGNTAGSSQLSLQEKGEKQAHERGVDQKEGHSTRGKHNLQETDTNAKP